MKTLFAVMVDDESGLILSAELILILTICVLGIVVGLVQLQTAIVSEFQDLSLAFSGMNQSFATPGFTGCRKIFGPMSWTAGSGFFDVFDGCVGVGAWNGTGIGGGGYAEIGGTTYSSSTSTTACPPDTDCPPIQTPTVPCETCPPGTGLQAPGPEHAVPSQPTPVQPGLPSPVPTHAPAPQPDPNAT